ncbi:hypothetical protein BJY04DRAFT_188352 [Aspergillus karnatakaensis]|uniref:uncharacterized protein n=1 Tax=Aspergillus karnatakaensis TaxID=1810916 RepID=UPI003CCDCE8C
MRRSHNVQSQCRDAIPNTIISLLPPARLTIAPDFSLPHLMVPSLMAFQVPLLLDDNLAYLTDGSLVPAKPDRYHGARHSQLEPALRKQLNKLIMPSLDCKRPVAPNFFIEATGHYGSVPVAIRQACYDGALGARAMHTLQQFADGGRCRYDNKAYTIVCTYHMGQLGIYVTHPTESRNQGRSTDYVMTQVWRWSLDVSPELYQQGLAAYRNARDLAKEFRDDFIRQANGRFTASQKECS